jgi:uroporphyrinogen-III decarboxylase
MIRTKEQMTSRERILATLRREEVDRFPVWLKMVNSAWKRAQGEPYLSMDGDEMLRACGCDVLSGTWGAPKCTNPHVRTRVEDLPNGRRTIHTTPDGDLVEEVRNDPVTGSNHPHVYPVKTSEDLAALRWLYHSDVRFEPDTQALESSRQRQKEVEAKDAVSMTGVGPSPLMHMVEHVAGPENAVFLMYDAPELFDETMDLMHQWQKRMLRAKVVSTAAETVWMTENTSTTLINPGMFEKYCMAHLADYAKIIQESGKLAVHHMCGKLDALLEMLDRLPADANEAYTTPPVGDTTLAAGRKRMPSKALIGGTNAALWLRPAEEIVEDVRRDLENCPDRRGIFLTSAGQLPGAVDFEKARSVVEQLKRL